MLPTTSWEVFLLVLESLEKSGNLFWPMCNNPSSDIDGSKSAGEKEKVQNIFLEFLFFSLPVFL